MEKVAKAPNYSATEVERLKAFAAEQASGLVNAAGVRALAEEMGKKPASIRSKLVQLKLYQAEPKSVATAKVEDGPQKKELLAELAALGVDTAGLDGATKAAIGRVIALAEKAAEAA